MFLRPVGPGTGALWLAMGVSRGNSWVLGFREFYARGSVQAPPRKASSVFFVVVIAVVLNSKPQK